MMNNMFFPVIKKSTSGSRIFIFVLLVVFGLVFGAVLSSAILLLCGDTLSELGKLRSAQICSQIVGFVFPPLFYAALVKEKPLNYLGFKNMQPWALLGIVTMFTILPFNTLITEWNESFTLPESMAGLEKIMREAQELAEKVTEQMLSVNGIGGLLINIVMIGALAAIGEELFFRSVLQPFFIRICKNPYIGIAVTAMVFSAVHFEFYGFIPRIVLGFMLGYMYYLSGSIWSSILMHLVNNSTIVVLFYLNFNNIIEIDVDNFGSGGTLEIIASIVVTMAIFVFCHRLRKRT